jgi:3-deoxy-manno-octulosonate cytidylyltransferase (CMP-KDO synthetase)
MALIALIPARLESTRLPGKPMLDICGLPMVVHVALRTKLSRRIHRAVVCTDSTEILLRCADYGIEVCLTAGHHLNGTERIAEAAATLGLGDEDIIVDVQGDEPFVEPACIEEVADFLSATGYRCVVPHQMSAEYGNTNRVKMVAAGDRVICFSRSDIPCAFATEPRALKKHLSIVGFRLPALRAFAASSPTPLEEIERVELMRLIELGEPIGTFLQRGTSLAVDTPEDYRLACLLMERDPLFRDQISRFVQH